VPKKSIMQTRVEAAREAEEAKLAELAKRKDTLLNQIDDLKGRVYDLDAEAAGITQTVLLLDALLAAPEEDEPEEVEA
jgi:hypothetical protein